MALYKVARTDSVDWDEYRSVIVRAKSEDEALRIVLTASSFFGQVEPLDGFAADGSNATVTRIETRGPSEIILRDYNAG